MKKLFLLAMLAVFQLSALKAQGDSPKVYTPVENYKFEVKDGIRFQEITIVDKVDVFNEKKRDEYHDKINKKIEDQFDDSYNFEQYCRILEKTAEYMVKYDSEGDVNAASEFCNYLYDGLYFGKGLFWGLDDLKRKEFKKNLKNLLKSKTPTDEEISYYNRIVETVEHYLDSVFATWVDTVTVERKFYMPVDMNDAIVSYREVTVASGYRSGDLSGEPFSEKWFEAAKLGSYHFEHMSEENKRLCYVRSLAYRWYPIGFFDGATKILFDFRYKNGDYVNGAKLRMSYKDNVDVTEIKDFSLTKDKGVFKKTGYSREFVLDNGDVLKNIESRPYAGRGSELYEADYFPYSGELYSASGEFKDKLSGGKWESELKAEEEARKKAEEAAAAEAREKELGELRKKYGERWVKIYEEGDYQKAIGMPEELAKKMFEDNYCKLINYSRWSDGSVYYDVFQCLPGSSSLGWLKGHVWFYNGKLSSWRFEN